MKKRLSLVNRYLATAALAVLLSSPVSAETVNPETAGQSGLSPKVVTAPSPAAETTASETGAGQKAVAADASSPASPSVNTAATSAPDGGDNPDIKDHSAEFKPIVNEFLKEGEGIPGSEVPYYSERDLTRKEWNAISSVEKDIRILQRERQKFFKDRTKEKGNKKSDFDKAFRGRQKYSIKFDPDDYTKKTMDANGEPVAFRAYEHLVYVEKPYEPEYQMLSIYIPEGYFRGETINGFTAKTAPIFMPNGVGGYMPGKIIEPMEESRHGGANSVLYALSNGYVVVSPAIRGRSLHSNGYDTGKAPALITDYKAAVRFVRHNRKNGRIPAGDTEKIIASGTSAGGALSALLGATGNAAEYVPFLKEIGAAKERDDIFAAMAYCPVTNLENADMAYEWMFHDADRYYNATPASGDGPSADKPDAPSDTARQGRRGKVPADTAGTLITPEQKEISTELREKFSEYLNNLGLHDSMSNLMNLTPDGDGLFREYVESLYLESAQDAIDSGEDLKKVPWLTISEGQAVHMDFPKYINAVKRLKGVPAFDAFDMSTGENNEFGTVDIPNRHFTRYAMEHSRFVTVPTLEEEAEKKKEKDTANRLADPLMKRWLQKANLEEQMEKDKLDWSQYMADWQTVRMMNPMRFIGLENVKTAPNWRIRHGSLDRDTAVAIPAMLALRLKNTGKTVDFKVPWGYGHDGDYDLPDLFAWTDRVAKLKDKTDEMIKAGILLPDGTKPEPAVRDQVPETETNADPVMQPKSESNELTTETNAQPDVASPEVIGDVKTSDDEKPY